METATDLEGIIQFYLGRQEYFEKCFIHVRTDTEALIKRYGHLKELVESTFSKEDLRSFIEENVIFKSLIEDSTQENQQLVEKFLALQGILAQAKTCNEKLLEEVRQQRQEGFARKLDECEEEKRKLSSHVAALEQTKACLLTEISFWRQNGDGLLARCDRQSSEIENIAGDVAAVKTELTRAVHLAVGEQPPDEPCEMIRGAFRMAMAVTAQFESSVNEHVTRVQHDIQQVAEMNASLESKCRDLEGELRRLRQERASSAGAKDAVTGPDQQRLQEDLVQEKLTNGRTLNQLYSAQERVADLEAEVVALMERCESSMRQLAVSEADRLDQEKRLDDALTNLRDAREQITKLEEQLQEERCKIAEMVNNIKNTNNQLARARQEITGMQQNNARQVEIFKEETNKLECRIKSMLLDLQTTEEQLGAIQDEKVKMVHEIEKKNEAILNLEVTIESIKFERDQHVGTIALLENKMRDVNTSFRKEINLKEDFIETLQVEVEKLEGDREQLISINGDVVDEVQEWQAMVGNLCQIVDKVSASLNEHTLEKESVLAKDTAIVTTSRLGLLFSSRELQRSASVSAESQERRSEVLADSQQDESSSERTQNSRTLTSIRSEHSTELRICVGGESVVASAVSMIDHIKAQLKAYVEEETRKRNEGRLSVSKAEETVSELKKKCEELQKNNYELDKVKNKYIALKNVLCKVREENRQLEKDLKSAEDTISRMEKEMNDFKNEVNTLHNEVTKGLSTIKEKCDTIKELENTVKDLRESTPSEHNDTKNYGIESTLVSQEDTSTYICVKTPLRFRGASEAITAQETAEEATGNSDFTDSDDNEYHQLVSELESRIKQMEISHQEEIEALKRSHAANMASFKATFEAEKAKERKKHEELVKEQQEMHEEHIEEQRQMHDAELSSIWPSKDTEHFSNASQTPDDWAESLSTDTDVTRDQKPGENNRGTAQDTMVLKKHEHFESETKPLNHRLKDEVESMRREHATKILEMEKDFEVSRAEEEAKLEKELRSFREEKERELSRLKARYSSDMKQAAEDLRRERMEVLRSAMAALSISKTETYKSEQTSGVEHAAETHKDAAHRGRSAFIGLDESCVQTLRYLIHNGPEVVGARQLSALHRLVCPSSCLMPAWTFLCRTGSSRTLLHGRSDLSDDARSALHDERFFADYDTESDLRIQLRNLTKLMADADRRRTSRNTEYPQAYTSESSSAPTCDEQESGITMTSGRSDTTGHHSPEDSEPATRENVKGLKASHKN